jgi:ankyrin repeat protein
MDNYISQILLAKLQKNTVTVKKPSVEDILISLNSDDICKLGRDNVPDYIWLIKKDKTIEEAAKNGNLIGVKHFIDLGTDIHIDNDVALRRSAENGHLFMVKYLVEHYGAAVNATNNEALQVSAKNGHLNVVNYLVEKGAVINEDELPSSNTDYLETMNYLAAGIL